MIFLLATKFVEKLPPKILVEVVLASSVEEAQRMAGKNPDPNFRDGILFHAVDQLMKPMFPAVDLS